ncbi:MAG: hypothetical protein J5818_03050 [Eggerthellaceae bacterium]|nr:hypothetical protein [Eggerthellaceae bacterium]
MAQSNIYGAGAAGILELFGDYVDGDAGCAVLVLGSKRPSDASITALDKSLATFGYGTDAFTVATTRPLVRAMEGGDIPLDPQALFLLVEGLDPLLVICIDETTVELLSQAYRTVFKPDSAERVFGRPAVMFRDLDALMESDAGKQKAWKLLKSLPRR